LLNRSTRPSVSSSFCLPVKNGWQLEQISRCSSGLVDRVFQVVPHAQRASTSKYLGGIASFTACSLAYPGNRHYTRRLWGRVRCTVPPVGLQRAAEARGQ